MAKTDENMAAAQEGKLKALQAAMAKIEKDYTYGKYCSECSPWRRRLS